MTWQEQMESVVADHLSGATIISVNTAHTLIALAEEEYFATQEELFEVLVPVAQEILSAQSGIASLVTLFNQVFFAANSEAVGDAAAQAMANAARNFLERYDEAQQALMRRATSLIPAGVHVLTHSSSNTVAQTLIHAAKVGRPPSVTCLEGRPLLEGREQALRLLEAGLEVEFIIDSAICYALSDIDLVLVGADTLCESGVISKIGTAAIATCAQAQGIPCYVLADTTKIWPSSLGMPPLTERDPSEVWDDAPEGLIVHNPYFDLTPWTAIAGVVTELSLLTAEEIKAAGRDKPVHRLLQSVIADVRAIA